jgi:hypothetical protein
MAKFNDSLLEQLRAESSTRVALDILGDKISKEYRAFIIACYEDQDLKSIYNGYREKNTLNDKKSDQRQILKIPNQIILRFLHDVLSPKYGVDWLNDRNTLLKICRTEDIIKPWITVKKL